MAIFNRIVTETDAKVIVSSAWRYFVLRGEMTLAGFAGMLCTHGLKWGCVVDVLGPDVPDGCGGADRGAAINDWFAERFGLSHKPRFVIFDDLDLGYTSNGLRFVQTPSDVGIACFTDAEIERIVLELKGGA